MGPVLPFTQAYKLPPNDPSDPYTFDVAHCLAPPIPPHPIIDIDLADLLSHPTPTSASTLLSGLTHSGYFRIRIPPTSPFAELIHLTTASALDFFALPLADKRRCRRECEYSKFTGFAVDGSRQFLQLRTCREGVPWPRSSTDGQAAMEVTSTALFWFLAAMSRLTLQALCEAPELRVDYTREVEPTLEPLPIGDARLQLRQLAEQQPWRRDGAVTDPRRQGVESLLWSAERREKFEAATARRAANGQSTQRPDRTEESAAGAEPAPQGQAASLSSAASPALASPPISADDGTRSASAATQSDDHYGVGSDVFRIYQYYRPADAAPPSIARAATGVHVDMGWLTVSPEANVPGLTVLHPDTSHWVDVETARPDTDPPHSSSGPVYLHVFTGELLSLLTRGRVRPAVHYVEERVGLRRISMPFFLRSNQHSLCRGWEVRAFLEGVAFPRRALVSMSERGGQGVRMGSQGSTGKVEGEEMREDGVEKRGGAFERKGACRWSDY